MMAFHQIVVFIGSIILVVAFIITIRVRNKEITTKPLNYFFLVPLIGILITVNTIFTNVLKVQNFETGGMIERILFALEFFFWIFFFNSIGLKITKYKGYTFFILIILLIVAFRVSYNFSSNKFHHYTNSLFFILESSFCLLYMNKIFSEPPQKPLMRNPVFLIVAGLLTKCAVAIPTLLASEIMYVGKNTKYYLLLFPISNIAILLMYLHFIYAFICIRTEYASDLQLKSEIPKS